MLRYQAKKMCEGSEFFLLEIADLVLFLPSLLLVSCFRRFSEASKPIIPIFFFREGIVHLSLLIYLVLFVSLLVCMYVSVVLIETDDVVVNVVPIPTEEGLCELTLAGGMCWSSGAKEEM